MAGDDADEARFFSLEEAAGLIEWSETIRVIHEAWTRFGA